MAVYHSLEEYRPDNRPAYVALGFFDGVHRGHRSVIQSCARDSGELPCVVLTFSESPARALRKTCPPVLTDNARKAELMTAIGADDVIFADFAAVMDDSPTAFVRHILCEKLNARRVYCGFNYRFGKGGAGDTAALKTICAEAGVEARVCPPVCVDGRQVSSTRIRELIAAGQIALANKMLGYAYSIGGVIGRGNHLGGGMGFPTVNLSIPDGAVVPRYGVYASEVIIGGAVYRGATNIGVHPTVGANGAPLCETFLLDYAGGDLYDAPAVCKLKAFIRPEKRFASPEELAAQVRADCEQIMAMINADHITDDIKITENS